MSRRDESSPPFHFAIPPSEGPVRIIQASSTLDKPKNKLKLVAKAETVYAVDYFEPSVEEVDLTADHYTHLLPLQDHKSDFGIRWTPILKNALLKLDTNDSRVVMDSKVPYLPNPAHAFYLTGCRPPIGHAVELEVYRNKAPFRHGDHTIAILWGHHSYDLQVLTERDQHRANQILRDNLDLRVGVKYGPMWMSLRLDEDRLSYSCGAEHMRQLADEEHPVRSFMVSNTFPPEKGETRHIRFEIRSGEQRTFENGDLMVKQREQFSWCGEIGLFMQSNLPHGYGPLELASFKVTHLT